MKKLFLLFFVLFFAVMSSWAQTDYVSFLANSDGWYSDDTRNSTGIDLVGLTLTHFGKPGQTPTAADDIVIGQQISFVGGPGNVGALKMDKTSSGGGWSKCTASKIDVTTGFATGNSWLAGFFCTYRYYTNSTGEVTVPKIGVQSVQWAASQASFTPTKSGESAWDLILVHWRGTNPGWPVNSWAIFSTDKDTQCWRIYRQAGNSFFQATPAISMSLQEIYNDTYWGPLIFGAGAKVTSFELGVGSSTQTSTSYIDYIQTNLLNGGNIVDFVTPIHNVTQNTYFNTIQAAIDGANPNEVIEVAEGNYTESVQIVINKNIDLLGASAATTILKPGFNTTQGGNVQSEAFIYVDPTTTDVVIKNFTFDCAGKNVHHAIQSRGALDIEDCIIQNVKYGTYLGRGIVFYRGTSNNLVKNVTFNNIERIGVHVRGNVTTPNPVVAVDHMIYTGKGAGLYLDYAVEFGGGGQGTVDYLTASDCLGVAYDNSTSAGVLITDYWGTGTQATVTNSTFTNNSYGISVGYGATDASIAQAHYNSFLGTGMGIQQIGTKLVSADHNYWGSTDKDQVFAKFTGLVDADSWCNSDFSVCNGTFPVINTNNGVGYPNLGAAIAAAENGDHITINNPGNSPGIIVNRPGKHIYIENTSGGAYTITGASPALTLLPGDIVTCDGITFTNETNAPTILNDGGNLTLRNCVVWESTGYDNSGILIQDNGANQGILDAGTSSTAGHNTFWTGAGGKAITNNASTAANAIGNFWGSLIPNDLTAMMAGTGTINYTPWCNQAFTLCAPDGGPVTYAAKLIRPAGNIVVPITVESFLDVSAISLKLAYTPSTSDVITYLSTTLGPNVPSDLPYSVTPSNGILIITAIIGEADIDGFDLANSDVLFNINFSYTGSEPVNFTWTETHPTSIDLEYAHRVFVSGNEYTDLPYYDYQTSDFYKAGCVTLGSISFTREYPGIPDGNTNEEILAVVSGGTVDPAGDYQFTWTGPGGYSSQSNPAVLPLGTYAYGDYTVTAMDDNGATITGTYYYGPVHNINLFVDHPTITAGVAAAAATGHTLTVDPGTYPENVTVNKELIIKKAYATKPVVQPATGIAFNIAANNVTIDGFEIKHTITDGADDFGFYLVSHHNCTIKNNLISGNSMGIWIQNGTNNDILTNVFDQNGVGIYFEEASTYNDFIGNRVQNCSLDKFASSDDGTGIYLDAGASHNVFNDNDILNNDEKGFYAWKPSYLTITNCTISGSKITGIELMGSSNNIITGNFIDGTYTTGHATYGLNIRCGASSSTANTITGNSITGSDIGIHLRDDYIDHPTYPEIVSGNTINHNKIYGNTSWGVYTEQSPPGVIYDLESNWWGDASGPYCDPYNTCGLGNDVSANVDFMPWFTDEAMTDPASGVLLVHNTNLSTNYCKIQDAINDPATLNEHAITVDYATYPEHVIINKDLTITGIASGSNKPIITGSGTGVVVTITSAGSGSTFEGFTVTGSGSILLINSGIAIAEATGCLIQNNEVVNNSSAGIGLQFANNNTILDNIISNNYVAAIGLIASSNNTIKGNTANATKLVFIDNEPLEPDQYLGYGIVLDNNSEVFSSGNIIISNTISANTSDGIYLGEGCNSNYIGWDPVTTTIFGNAVTGNLRDGIYFWKSGNQIVKGNTVTGNTFNGIHLMGSSSNTITDNTVSTNLLDGIQIRAGAVSSTNNSIQDNTINANSIGVSLEDSQEPGYTGVVSDNTIFNNGIFGNTHGLITSDVPAGQIYTAESNWWGDAGGPYCDPYNTCGGGNDVSANVDFIDWCLAADCSTTGHGTALNVYNTDKLTYYCKIQDAVDDANSGDDITVESGTYTEQVSIPISLTLTGIGTTKPIILAPDTRTKNVTVNPATLLVYDYVVAAYPASGTIDVKIDNVIIDANNQNPETASKYAGLIFKDIAGTGSGFFNSEIRNFGDNQENYGLNVYGASNLTIDNNDIMDYQRNGITAGGNGSGGSDDPVVVISNNEVTGTAAASGTNLSINGIQLSWGTGGTISGNIIKDNDPYGVSWAGCGILISENTSAIAINNNNQISNCDDGIGLLGASNVTMSGNTLSGILDHGILLDNSSGNFIQGNNFDLASSTSLNAAVNINNGSTGNIIGGSGFANTINLATSGTGNLRGINLAGPLETGVTNTVSYNTFNGGKHVIWQNGGTSANTVVTNNTIGATTSPVVAGLYFDSGILDIRANTMTLDGTVNQGIFMNNACGTGSVIGGDLPAVGNTITFAGAGTGGMQYAIQTGGADEARDFTIKYNTITGGERGVQIDGPQTTGGGIMTISYNTFSNTAYGAIVSYNKKAFSIDYNTLNSNARPMELFNPLSLNISNNTITGSTYDGINISNFTGTASSNINNNTITGCAGGAGIHAQTGSNNLSINCNNISASYRGINIESGCTGVIITNNSIDNNSWSGITSISALLNVTGNTISNSWRGIEMSNALTANFNRFTGNIYGSVIFYTDEAHDVTNNWWNSANGPVVLLNSINQNTFNQGAQGETIQANNNANFTFAPWLTNGTDNDGGTCGFQPAAGTSFAPVYANATGVVVDETQQFGSIQAANNGTSLPYVFAKYGTYTEKPVLNNDVTTFTGIPSGSDKPIISGSNSGTVVTITANNITLDGFDIRNSGLTSNDAGVLMGTITGAGTGIGVTGCKVQNSTFTTSVKGIAIAFGSNNTLKSNTMTANGDWSILLGASSNNLIESNIISNNVSSGIYLDNESAFGGGVTTGSTSNTINLNSITNTAGGESLNLGENCNGNIVTGNTIDGGSIGIHVWKSHNQTITGNTVRDITIQPSPSYSAVAIRLRNAQNNIISANTIIDNMKGFEVVANNGEVYCTGNVIHNNLIYANGSGIDASPSNGNYVVDARYNWWGYPTGPIHSSNPCGEGNSVTDWVTFSPWYYDADTLKLNGLTPIAMSDIPDVSTITATPVILAVTASYQNDIEDYDPAVMTDAKFISDVTFPDNGRVISVKYNGTEQLATPFNLPNGINSIYLSEVLGGTAYPLFGHDNLTVNWELILDGFDQVQVYNFTLQAVSYITTYTNCNNILGTEAFVLTFADLTAFDVVTTSATVCNPAPLAFNVTIGYPVIQNLNTAILADCRISSDVLIPAGTQIKWGYDAPPTVTYTLPAPTDVIYLSTITGMTVPLQGHSGTDVWNIEIISANSALVYTLTVQPAVRLGALVYLYGTSDATSVLTMINCGLSGTLKYNNAVKSPMNGVDLTVNLGTGVTVTTNANGEFTFPNMPNGNYTIEVTDNPKVPGSINSTDAAQVNYWGTHHYSIEYTRFLAGDVVGDGTFPNYALNATDATNIQLRFVNPAHNFDRDSWSYWKVGQMVSDNGNLGPIDVTVSNASVDGVNLYGQVTGDFNMSYIWSPVKDAKAMIMLTYFETRATGALTETELPVRIVNPAELSAASLVLTFPEEFMEVLNVTMNQSIGQFDWAVYGNELRIGWNSAVPVSFAAGEELVVLRIKTTENFIQGNSIRLALTNDPVNELADGSFFTIPDAVLSVDVLESNTLGTPDLQEISCLSLTNHPNPFAGFTTLTYALPSDGYVTLEIHDMLGNKVVTIVDEKQASGRYTVKLDATLLQPGIYTANIRLNTNYGDLIKTIKLVRN